MSQKNYKTPLAKLVKFFEESRDNWKTKHQNKKEENKSLKNKVRFLQSSKQRWKDEALNLRKQLKKATASAERIAKKNKSSY